MSDERELEKEKIRKKYRAEVTGIKKIEAIPQPDVYNADFNVNVAAYCRVSTDDPKQTSSYELQKIYYENMVKNHDNWTLVDIYADEGISGTSLNHRDEFKRMIHDCEFGNINLIVTKSVSRFARNILDCIATVRRLKEHNPPIYVYFETENIRTSDANYELMLSMLAAFAQEESKTKSEIMNYSVEHRFERGIFLTPKLLGYDRDKELECELYINEEEAKTVRLCFAMTLDGYSTKEIAETLNVLQRKSKLGNIKWTSSTVLSVLRNERHCGAVRAHKTYTPNYLDHKSKRNSGERNQYIKDDHHDAIVSQDVFNMAQKIIEAHRHGINGRLPVLNVVKDGILKGFVSVNRCFPCATIDDFIEANSFAYIGEEGRLVESQQAFNKGEVSSFDLSGYQTVNTQLFNIRDSIMVTIGEDKIVFNTALVRKFNGARHIEMLFNPKDFVIAFRPCKPDNPNAIEWTKTNKDGNLMGNVKGCKGFANILFDYMEWNPDYKYRCLGVKRSKNDEGLIFIDLKNPEVCVADTSPSENIQLGKLRKSVVLFSKDYAYKYGEEYYQSLYSCRLYMIDMKGLWNAYLEGTAIKDESELVDKAHQLFDEYMKELKIEV